MAEGGVFKNLQVVLNSNAGPFVAQMTASRNAIKGVNAEIKELALQASAANKQMNLLAASSAKVAKAQAANAAATRSTQAQLTAATRLTASEHAAVQTILANTAKAQERLAEGQKRQQRQQQEQTRETSKSLQALNVAMAGSSIGTGKVQQGLLGYMFTLQGAGAASIAATTGFVGLAAAAVAVTLAMARGQQVGAQFDAQLRTINSILIESGDSAAETEQQFRQMSTSILNISGVGQGPLALAEGLYTVAQAGFEAERGLAVLEPTARFASAGLVSMESAATAVVGVLNAYGLALGDANQVTEDATRVTDALFAGVAQGVLSVQDVTQGIGEVVGIAAAAGVEIEEVMSAIATMTQTGLVPAESFTSLKRLLSETLVPGEEMTEMLRQLGYESGQAALDAEGLQGIMLKIGEATGGSVSALKTLFTEERAARGAFLLLSNEGQNYIRVSEKIGDQTKTAGATLRAFNEQQKSTIAQLGNLGDASERVLAILFAGGQTGIANSIESIANFVNQLGDLILVVSQIPEVKSVFDEIGISLSELKGTFGETFESAKPLFALLGGALVLNLVAFLKTVNVGLQALNAILGLTADKINEVTSAVGAVTKYIPGLDALSKKFTDTADSINQLTAAEQGATSALSEYDKQTAALDEYEKKVGSLKDSWRSLASEALSPQKALQKATQDMQRTSERSFDARARSITRSFQREEKAIKDRYDAESEALENSKKQIVNHEFGATSAIQTRIDKLKEQEDAEIDALNAQKERAQDQERSAKEAAANTQLSLDGLIKSLQKTNEAFNNWYTNLREIGKKAGPDATVISNFLQQLGPEAAGQIAKELAAASGADWDRAVDTIKENIHLAGGEASDQLLKEMHVLGVLTKQDVARTADDLALLTNIGANEVARIAQQYGYSLATAANSVLEAVGAQKITINQQAVKFDVTTVGGVSTSVPRFAEGGVSENHTAEIAKGQTPYRIWAEPETGGEAYIPLARSKAHRSVPILREAAAHFGLSVVDPYHRRGYKAYAQGGIDAPKPPDLKDFLFALMAESTMDYTYKKVEDFLGKAPSANVAVGDLPAGSGAAWLIEYLRGTGVANTVTSTTGGRHAKNSLHYAGKAVDFVGPNMMAIYDQLLKVGSNLQELIYSAAGVGIKNGKPVDIASFYGPDVYKQHWNHVHAATYDQGGMLQPGFTMAYNGTGKPEPVVNERMIANIAAAVGEAMGGGRPGIGQIVINEKNSSAETVREIRRKFG